VLTRIFALPNVIVIGVANSLGLVFRHQQKAGAFSASRVDNLAFKPYAEADLVRIVAARVASVRVGTPARPLAQSDLFEPNALEWLCRAVAKANGDCRKVLDLALVALDAARVERGSDSAG